jgi:protein-disulfide isomerase
VAQKKSGDKGLRNTVIGTVIFAVVALGAVAIYSNGSSKTVLPASTSKSDGFGITFNKSATPQIDIWEDFQCPICRTFEGINNSYINDLAKSGRAKVVFHPMSFIGIESVVAANAAACSNEESRFLDFHKALYENQSSTENSGRWTPAAMLSLGKSIGLSTQKFTDCVNNNKFTGWVKSVEDAAAAKNVNATPTVFVNGKEIDRKTQYMDANAFKAAIAAAGAK